MMKLLTNQSNRDRKQLITKDLSKQNVKRVRSSSLPHYVAKAPSFVTREGMSKKKLKFFPVVFAS